MMTLTFYTKQNGTNSIDIPDESYKRLAESGLDSVGEFKEINVIVEDEEYEINAIELIDENRKKLIEFIEKERHEELKKVFKEMENKPTLKEIRGNLEYIKYMTCIYEQLIYKDNIYFSYD